MPPSVTSSIELNDIRPSNLPPHAGRHLIWVHSRWGIGRLELEIVEVENPDRSLPKAERWVFVESPYHKHLTREHAEALVAAATMPRAATTGFDPDKRGQGEDIDIVIRGMRGILPVVSTIDVNVMRASIRCRSKDGTEGGTATRWNIARGVLQIPVDCDIRWTGRH